MADFDYDGPAMPDLDDERSYQGMAHAPVRRPYVGSVQFSLSGSAMDVQAALEVLRAVFAVSVAHSQAARRGNKVHVYGEFARSVPLTGGDK